jgi:hypothetical protein
MYDYESGLRRRREASWRLLVLADGHSDPWHYDEPPSTAHQLDGAVAAAEYLMVHGLAPVFRIDTIRALWRRGDRRLAVKLARLQGAA